MTDNSSESKKTSIRLENDTLAILNECEAIEARRRGLTWMKHDTFLRFALQLYKKSQCKEDGKTLLYLAMKEELDNDGNPETEK